jgi:hypothetical protein
MRMTPWYVLTSSTCVKRTKRGMSMTTGGTTIRATLTARSASRPRKRMRAMANAANAATIVERTTELSVKIALLPNQTKNFPPRRASSKLPQARGQGRPSLSTRYCSRPLSAVVTIKNSG